MTGCPTEAESLGWTMRAIVSVVPPIGYGTTIRIGFEGQDCALASEATKNAATADTVRIMRPFR
jgi:hypothetical protein